MTDPVTASLAELTATPPDTLRDRVTAYWTRRRSPIGEVDVAYTENGVALLRPAADGGLAAEFRDRFARPLLHAGNPPAALDEALSRALADGDGRAVPCDLTGLSPFAAAVLRAAAAIPRGHTRPYQWIAARIDNPRAVRAVGTALGRNPIPLVIPCHRVVRADGAPGRYIFGDDAKLRLLRHEGAVTDDPAHREGMA